MDDAKLVYSTDPMRNKVCPGCKNLIPECSCEDEDSSKPGFTAVIRLEVNGRGGKTVTLIDKLPPSDNYLVPLEKLLKSRAGSGGTHYAGASGGVIEIQGDKRELIRKILKEKGIPFKG
jgi:translation initiation factor 1